ncbi:MAG: hypothetical protein IRZ15_11610 [Bryobacteraceae bacterium]|nr:hypothetical protein [Bryobacteraceae bacterium]
MSSWILRVFMRLLGIYISRVALLKPTNIYVWLRLRDYPILSSFTMPV